MDMDISKSLARTLRQASPRAVAVFAAVTSFGVYFCMYAFRKPFTAAGFEGQSFLNIPYKVWLVAAQVMGYMFSKFYGIRFISSIGRSKRAVTIACLIFVAWVALLLFALTPAPYNIVFLFINGFPLGMVWGLVFSYLEGRRLTEAMGAVLASSFIFSSGVVKSVGKYLLQEWRVSEGWMPFVAGALFIIPLLIFTWLLKHVPPPSDEDVRLRTERKPMNKEDRRQFLARYLPGLSLIVVTYVFLTILRDFRDNFANELWTELGYGQQPSIFAKTEVPVSIIVLLSMALLILVQSNIKAFLINHAVIVFGYLVCMGSTFLFLRHYISPVLWMTLTGTGLYMAYVPFNALYFERMIATFQIRGNVGFVMYIADSFGYLGSVLVLFLKEFSGIQLSWTRFFVHTVFIVSAIGIVGTVIAAFYFRKKHHTMQNPVTVLYAA
jgi:MFS family permease